MSNHDRYTILVSSVEDRTIACTIGAFDTESEAQSVLETFSKRWERGNAGWQGEIAKIEITAVRLQGQGNDWVVFNEWSE
jgi:hypothetical protein